MRGGTSVSIDGEEYVPRRMYDEVREERDRLAQELERLRKDSPPESDEAPD